MIFNPDPSKQAQEVIFTRKLQKKDYPLLYFNDSSVKDTCTQKHLGMLLDFRLDFQEHWKSLIISTIYECVFSIHLDYGDIIYDQAFNNSFHKKMNPYYITQL